MDVYIGDKRLRVSPSASIGKGGEADVFDIGGGLALKLWKTADHPDVKGLPEEEFAASERLRLVQDKMKVFPRGLPDRVVCPIDLVTDKKKATILGYTMQLVSGAESLLGMSEPAHRRALGGNAVAKVLVDLWKTVCGVHASGVVMGDFNDLNVLVRNTEAYVVDADSFQFGAFRCPVFTERFIDPLLCDPNAARPTPMHSFSRESDWYAFAVMVMSALLCVGPYGGVYRPKDVSRRMTEAQRPLRRVTVFNPEVRYPKPAIAYRTLPDDLLHAFSMIFERDVRAPLSLELLEALRFTHCTACGAEHARARCPECDHGIARECVVVRGHVKATRHVVTAGTILCAALRGDKIEYVIHEASTYKREDGSTIVKGPLDVRTRLWTMGKKTFIARSGRVIELEEGKVTGDIVIDSHSGEPAFVVNERYAFYVQGGRLWRRGGATQKGLAGQTAEPWGDVLAGQTRIWVGERIGFGYYRAGSVSVAFTFDTEKRGIRDSVRIPWPNGQIIAADAAIDEDRIWFFLAFAIAGRILHRCVVIGADGVVLGSADADCADGSWLGTIAGKRAVGGVLFAATDTGIVRVEVGPGGPAQTRRFADTEPFVDSAARLFVGRDGIWVVDSQAMTKLAMGN